MWILIVCAVLLILCFPVLAGRVIAGTLALIICAAGFVAFMFILAMVAAL